jgi:hypothetical protein
MTVQGNDIDIIKNERWSNSWGPAYAVTFNHFYFFEDGKFDHEFGYSGGMYWENHIFGKYNYNIEERIITIEIEGILISPFSFGGDNINNTPKIIKIVEITENSITFIKDDNVDIINMRRRTGITSDYYWFEGWNSSHDRFSFDLLGQCKIRQNEIDYNCEYWLVDNVLYLLVKNRIFNRKTKPYDPYIKTFLKVEINEETVMIENVIFEEILDGNRNWEYINGKFKIPKGIFNNTWIKYTRIYNKK